MSSLIEFGNRLPRVVVGMFNLRHNVRRDARPRLGGEKVGAELVGVEHEAAMTRARRCPAHLNRPCQWVLRRDVARLLVAGRAHAGGRRRAAYAIDRAAASERGDNERGRAGECCARRDAAGSPSHGGAILAVERRRLKGWRTALIGAKKERRSFGAPPPCAMSASRPFGTISRRRETFRSLVTRSASRLPAKRRRDPTTVLILRRVATTRPRPWPGLNLWRRDLRRRAPFRLHLTALRRRRKTVALRACAPLRLQPSMAVDDPRLALPCELCRLLSGAFGFLRRHRSTIGAAHTEEHSA